MSVLPGRYADEVSPSNQYSGLSLGSLGQGVTTFFPPEIPAKQIAFEAKEEKAVIHLRPVGEIGWDISKVEVFISKTSGGGTRHTSYTVITRK